MNNRIQQRFDRSIREAGKACGQFRKSRRQRPSQPAVAAPGVRVQRWDNPVPMACDSGSSSWLDQRTDFFCHEQATHISVDGETAVGFHCDRHCPVTP